MSGWGAQSLTLPAGSSATSPVACTSICHPTARFFVRNTRSASARLTVQTLDPGLLGKTQVATIGTITGSSAWQRSTAIGLLVPDLLSTVSLDEMTIALRAPPPTTRAAARSTMSTSTPSVAVADAGAGCSRDSVDRHLNARPDTPREPDDRAVGQTNATV